MPGKEAFGVELTARLHCTRTCADMRFGLSTCIKAERRGEPTVARGQAARCLLRGLWAAWVVEMEVAVAGQGSVCCVTEVAWAI